MSDRIIIKFTRDGCPDTAYMQCLGRPEKDVARELIANMETRGRIIVTEIYGETIIRKNLNGILAGE